MVSMFHWDGNREKINKDTRICVVSPAGDIEEHTLANARDLIKGGWTQVASDACEICAGRGNVNEETCWHCAGDGIDPGQ
jgi:predicted cupin superfamily sugar epimerase